MKSRFFLVFFASLLSCLLLNQVVDAAIALYLNDVEVDMPVAPRIIAGRVTIPVDLVCAKLGFAFGWSTTEQFWLDTGSVYYGEIGSDLLRGRERVVSLGAPAVVEQGHLFIPLPTLADLLGLKLTWDGENRALRLYGEVSEASRREMGEMQDLPGTASSQGTGSSISQSPTDEASGRGPSGMNASGEIASGNAKASDAAKVNENADRTATAMIGRGESEVSPDLACVRSVSMIRENTRQSLEVIADRPIKANVSLLQEPPRLVIDIAGAVLPKTGKLDFTPQGLVKNLRLSQFQSDVVRIVVDLERMTGYQVEELTEGRVAIHLNEIVESMSIVRDERIVTLSIRTSGEVQPETMLLREPDRLVVDLIGTTLAMPATASTLSDPLVDEVRVSQFQPHIVRTVLQLKELLTPEQITVVSSQRGTEVILAADVQVPDQGNHMPYIVWSYVGAQSPQSVPKVGQEVAKDSVIDLGEAAVGLVSAEELADMLNPRAAAGMTVEETATKLKYVRNKVIVVDAGHGGLEVGAAGRQGMWEKDMNLDVALKVAKGLELAGAKVYLTRSTDVVVPLHERAECANTKQADAFVSIHFNASYFKQAKGTETLFRHNHPASQALAASLQRMLSDVLETVDRGIKVREDLYILRHSKVPTALVEVGFLDHEEEGVRFLDPAEREKAAIGVLLGVDRFFARLEAGEVVDVGYRDFTESNELSEAGNGQGTQSEDKAAGENVASGEVNDQALTEEVTPDNKASRHAETLSVGTVAEQEGP